MILDKIKKVIALLYFVAFWNILNIIGQTISVSGNAFLPGETDHSGVEVQFQQIAPGSDLFTFNTNSAGAFAGLVTEGVYDVFYSKTGGYCPGGVTLLGNSLYSDSVYADTTLTLTIGGTLTGTYGPGTYHVTCNATAGAGLNILPGARFEFDPGISFTIPINTVISGSKTDSVVFTSATASMWTGIIEEGNIQLNYCVVENASVAIRENGSHNHVTLNHCTLDGNTTAIYYSGISKDNTLDSCVISNNGTGLRGISTNECDLTASYTQFIGNTKALDLDLTNTSVHIRSYVTFDHCVFSDNGSGPDLTGRSLHVNTYSSEFYNNGGNVFSGNGTSGYGWAKYNIHECVFDGSGTFRTTGASWDIRNSTFNSNQSFSINGSSFIKVYNSIMPGANFGGNSEMFNTNHFGGTVTTGQSFTGVPVSTNANGDPIDPFGNTSIDPDFEDALNDDFRLKSTSSCIDAGDNSEVNSALDIDEKARIWDGNNDLTATVDMGAYEYGAALPNEYDLGVVSIETPINSCLHGSTEVVSIAVRNYGRLDVDSFTISYSIDSGLTWVNELVPTSLLNTEEEIYSFAQTADMSTTGLYNVVAVVTLNDDIYQSNDTLISQIYTYPVLTSITNPENPECYGEATGSALVNVSGIAGPFGYLWDNPSQSVVPNPTDLVSGWNVVTVSTLNGCEVQDSVYLSSPTEIKVGMDSTNATCVALINDGMAIAQPTGGSSVQYTFLWNDSLGTTSDTLVGMAPYETYQVTVSDSLGCSVTRDITLGVFTEINSNISVDSISCFGLEDGKTFVNPIGGSSPYSIIWNDTINADSLTGLSVGIYNVFIVDSLGCIGSDSIEVIEPLAMQINFVNTQGITCHDDNNGHAQVITTGGTTPYQYSWQNSASTTSVGTALASGYQSVTVTDNRGCEIMDSIHLINPDSIIMDVLITNPVCAGTATGALDLTLIGGVTPFQISWSNGSGNEDISNLYSGIYSLILQDNNGCIRVKNVTIQDPDPLQFNLSVEDESCVDACDGMLSITPQNGMPPYVYNWSNGDSTLILTNLCPGTYELDLTDARGCNVQDDNLIVEAATPIIATVQSTSTPCDAFGGTAFVFANGGAGNLSYIWSNGDTLTNIENLGAGIHAVKVIDDNNCTKVTPFSIPSNGTLAITLNQITDVVCGEASTGSVDISISGGNAPYSIVWSNSTTTEDLANVPKGSYWVEVTDSSGCVQSATYLVDGPDPLNIDYNAQTANCGQANGSIDITVSGGTPNYSYNWSTGSFSADIENLTAGVYTLALADGNSCVDTINIALSNANGPQIIIDSIHSVPCGATDGSIFTSIISNAPVSYNWSNGDTTSNLIDVPGGFYNLIATDAFGCIGSQIVVLQDDKPTVTEICIVDVKDSVNSNAVRWNPATDSDIIGYNIYRETVASGVYSFVQFVDTSESTIWVDSSANPSIRSYRYKIGSVNSCGEEAEYGAIHKTMHLTMNLGLGGAVNLIWEHYEGFAFGTYIINRYTTSAGWEILDSVPSNITSYTDLTPQINSDLTYYISVLKPGGCFPQLRNNTHNTTRSNTAEMPARKELSSAILITNTIPGNCNGLATLLIEGGQEPYSFIWSGNVITSDSNNASTLCEGNYSVMIFDSFGDSTEVVFVVESDSTSTILASTEVLSNDDGTCLGAAVVTPTGGVPPYIYQWDGNTNNQSTSTADSLCAGTYSVKVSDQMGNFTFVFATISKLTGLNSIVNDVEVEVYPNPMESRAIIDVRIADGIPLDLTLFNLLGEEVWSRDQVGNGKIALERRTLSAGIYYLKVIKRDHSLLTKKIVIE